MRRKLLTVAPFALIAFGAWCIFSSPWLAIFRLMRQGAHVRVVPGWETVGLPAVALACFAAAIALSLKVKR